MTSENQQNDGSATVPDAAAAAAAAMAAAEHDPAATAAASQASENAVLQAKLDDLQSRLVRTLADMENYRRRAQRELEESRRFESLRLVRDLLPALDGLNRAIASGEQTADPQALLSGIRMVAQQFRDILRGHAAEPIDALGQPFDPNLHEALTQIPSAEHPPMTVLQVVELGYRMHDRVVRPARVIVSSAPPAG
ncbi:MAG: cofactor [Planctomycetota bacterium]|jgi:molecular chaperone GrpE